MTEERELAARFAELHRPGDPLVMPNPWDVGSAKILEHLGFAALATTSSGLAATHGLLDYHVSREVALAHAKTLAGSVDVPVSADLENGYADDLAGLAETYRLARETGLSGASIEDFDPTTEALYDLGAAVERVAAASEAFHGGDVRPVLTGRTEAVHVGQHDLGETVRRLQAYQGAGADVLYAPFLTDLSDIRSVVESLDRPVNVLLRPGGPSVSDLAAAGVARISIGGGFAYVALGALVTVARQLQGDGSYAGDLSRLGAEAARAAFGAARDE